MDFVYTPIDMNTFEVTAARKSGLSNATYTISYFRIFQMIVKKSALLRFYSGFCDCRLQREAAALETPKAAVSFRLSVA